MCYRGCYFLMLASLAEVGRLAGSILCARAKRQSTPGVCGTVLQEYINIYQG